MKAVVMERYGTPDVLEIRDVPTPTPKANELLVRVFAAFAGEHDKTGLHWAAETDQAEVVRILLDAGADIDAKTSWGASPLEWAATMGSARVADLLL